MNCRNAEKLILRSKDQALSGPEAERLEAHLRRCPACLRLKEDYARLFQDLVPGAVPTRRPLSWERLRARIEEREAAAFKPLYERWALRAIPAAVALALLIGSASLLFKSSPPSEYTPSEELLLRNTNPLVEARTILEQKRLEDQGLMLIFASNEGGSFERR